MWFVNEEISPEFLACFPQERSVVYVEGRDGSYEHFMTKLYALLSEDASFNARFGDNLLLDMIHQLHTLQEKVHVLEDQITNLKNSRTSNSLNIQNEQ